MRPCFDRLLSRTDSSSLIDGRHLRGIDFRELRALISMAEVLELMGFQAREASGQQRRGPCLLHGSDESSRVFSVNLAKNALQAALDLCQRLNREIPWLKSAQR